VKKHRARKHLATLIALAKAVGAWYNAPNKEVEEGYRKEVMRKYDDWCEYRHDYVDYDPFKDTIQDFINELCKN